MNRLRALLVVLLGIGLAAGMVTAGMWQLRVYHRQGAQAAARRAAAPPVPLTEAAPVGVRVRDGYGRTVTFSGSYEAVHQVLVPMADRTDVSRVVTLLRQDDGSAVAVVRGLVSEGSAAPPPPDGPQTQSGILLPSEDPADSRAGQPDQSSVRVPQLAQSWPGPLVDGFVTLAPAEAKAQGLEPVAVTLPEAAGGLRNGAYALQWWMFAAFTVVMSVRMARDVARPAVAERLPSPDG
jgi:surfeit locus 1 family protein